MKNQKVRRLCQNRAKSALFALLPFVRGIEFTNITTVDFVK
jgi:hypothetical protein